ncbi:hypothetical protein E1281_24475 [Actinomadura sp. KC345]|uniref:hypothetical protein n=1 Tax=Actinomadura sp. KC345 TaxID=2530371 RepID=UPI00104559E7|nr:hypothetical protein [Actinomadura sp. KC345]TDC48631.1 hypothetical protein E1281_24475 [Actinomadura sp. KC345]
MALSRRTKIFIAAAGLAGAGTVAGGGAALAHTGPEPVQTRLQIVDHKASHAGAPGRDCPGGKDGQNGQNEQGVAEGTR